MPYRHVGNGSSYIEFGNIGRVIPDATTPEDNKTFSFTIRNIYRGAGTRNLLIHQGNTGNAGGADFSFYIWSDGTFQFRIGDGGGNTAFDVDTLFSSVLDGSGNLELDWITFDFVLRSGGADVNTWSMTSSAGISDSGTFTRGTTAVGNAPFRIGQVGSSFPQWSGNKVGDVTVAIDGSDVFDSTMPSTGTLVTENIASNTGTLINGTGDGSDWEFVAGANNPPVANDDTSTVDQDSNVLIDVLANDTDLDPSDTLTIDSVGTPSNGTAVIEAGQVRYTPNSGYVGADSFTYVVTDGTDTDTATVSITVNATGATVTAPTISRAVYAIDLSTLETYETLTGTYTGSPTTIEYRVMDGVAEVETWQNVSSFTGGNYDIDGGIPIGDGLTIEVRADGVNNVVSSSFVVGVVCLITGDSQAEDFYTTGTSQTINTVVYRGSTRHEAATTITGAGIAAAANAIHDNFADCPVQLLEAGVNASRLTVGWNPSTGANFASAVTLADGNISLVFESLGYNDAHQAGITLTQAQIENIWANYRSQIRAGVPIIAYSLSTYINADQDGVWQAVDANMRLAYNADSNVYPIYAKSVQYVDSFHFDDTTYNRVGQQAGSIVSNIMGASTPIKGAELQSPNRVGTAVTVTLDTTNTDYTQITPLGQATISPDVFEYRDDSNNVIAINSVTIDSATQLTLNLASSHTGQGSLGFAAFEQNWGGTGLTAANGYPICDGTYDFDLEPVIGTLSVTDSNNIAPLIVNYRRRRLTTN